MYLISSFDTYIQYLCADLSVIRINLSSKRRNSQEEYFGAQEAVTAICKR